jgi:hypothetical protein
VVDLVTQVTAGTGPGSENIPGAMRR